jgi:predicted PhzF superfamily epimerase YddE/YHI9
MGKPSFSLIAVFTDPAHHFKGNVAAVVMGDKPYSNEVMQSLAADLNQPATSFLWPAEKENEYHVRWFATDAEIGLCGHGSLAAIVYLAQQSGKGDPFTLLYPNGQISGRRNTEGSCSLILAAIPVLPPEPVPDLLPQALGIPVLSVFPTDNKSIVLVENQQDVQRMKPDFALLRQLPTLGYAVTAPGEEVDFVSRTLVPHFHQLEDSATGSSHAALAPFWAQRLNQENLVAHQLSSRGGKFTCEVTGDQVLLRGESTLIATGQLLQLPDLPHESL